MSLIILSSLLTSMAFAMLVARIVPPPRRLHARVYPYLQPSLLAVGGQGQPGILRAVFSPLVFAVAEHVGALLDRSGQAVAIARLRHAGWFRGMPEDEMIASYRMMQLRSLASWTVVAAVLGQVIQASVTTRFALLALGLIVGGTRTKARLEREVAARRERMRIEIYTVNQLLAMRVRSGGGVVQAVKAVVARGSGAVVGELEEALRLHRAGWRGPDAFRRIAELSPEPFCSRTYRLLASSEEKGANLADALLALSEDVRETRREAVKRMATRRRAAMLIPTIAILAPVLILFVVAPLPYLITSWQ